MDDVEEYFPRGGKKPTITRFKQSDNFLGAIEKVEKKKKKSKKRLDGDDGYLSEEDAKDVEQSYKACATGIKIEIVKPGLLILGRVRQVLETKVNVMLPGKMMGSVMACHISEPYNKLLEAYVNDQTEKVPELVEIFSPGQYVVMKVLEVLKGTLMLSMMPQHVNGNKLHTDLHKGTILQAAVTSVEDHGYVMDVGVTNTRAFLPSKHANPDIKLDTGAVTWCVVKSVSTENDTTTLKLGGNVEALKAAVVRRKSTALLPASQVEFVVDKSLESGIEGHIFGDTTAYVQRWHADNGKGKKPKLGQKIQARVLYVMPTRNCPFLTTRDIFASARPDLGEEQALQEGDIVDDAKVIKIIGRSIHFRLGPGCVGTMSLRRIHVDEDLTDEEVIAKSYPTGSVHRVRVLCYHLSDYLYSVTDEQRVLDEPYFSIGQLSVGELVRATVTAVDTQQLHVAVGRVAGCVPRTHLSDAGIYLDPKKASVTNLSKKFRVGQVVQARVLALDAARALAYLTLKPSLLDPRTEPLASYRDAAVGKAYVGSIAAIRDYLLVKFFNNVTAFVPRQYVTRDATASLRDLFHLGQKVDCTILKVDPDLNKMTGSLVTLPFWPAKKRLVIKNENFENKSDVKKITDTTEEIKIDKKKRKNEDGTEIIESEVKVIKKKKRKQGEEIISDDETANNTLNALNKVPLEQKQEQSNKGKNEKNKKRKKDKNEEKETEESDAIETDLNEDSDQVLAPKDLALMDLSNCVTAKKCKKRVVSLIKAIKCRTTRLNRLEKRINKIEDAGLTVDNKKMHTDFHMEKNILHERIQKLMSALTIAQTKYKEFIPDDVTHEQNKQKKEMFTEAETEKIKGNQEPKAEKPKLLKNIKFVENLEPILEVPSAKDFWSVNTDSQTTNVKDDSSSSDEEEEPQPKKKRKKLSAAEKVAKAREEEERVREQEARALASDAQPRSVEQFERALLASPDCSQLWIAYMAFHLQATEIEKARAVGRKALQTIGFREEADRLNVWVALLNCEHRFGTQEYQQKTLEEALQMNEPFEIHSKLLDILVETSKQQELTHLVDLMIRKHKRNPATYTRCGSACFRLGLIEKARQVMQKAVSVLEKKEHVGVLVQFALLERGAGQRERAEALLEQVLAAYPQRVDVVATYADMLVKAGDLDRVRQVMERMTAHKLPARKMKILYKKWIEIEEKLGDSEHVESVRQLAMDYIDKAKF